MAYGNLRMMEGAERRERKSTGHHSKRQRKKME
jgi:hypothetical protein